MRNLQTAWHRWTVIAVCLLLVGCRQHLLVKVERVDYPGAELDTTQVAAAQECFERYRSLVCASPTTTSELKRISKWSEHALTILTDTELKDSVTAVKAAADEAVVSANGAPDEALAAQAVAKFNTLKPLLQGNDAIRLQYTAVQTSIRENRFGGLVTRGVFMIDPSSEVYRYVLAAGVIGEPLCKVDVTAGETSTFIIVQESPGYFRIKQISNDPTKTLQNLSFVADMALRAAAQAALTGGLAAGSVLTEPSTAPSTEQPADQ